VEGRVEGGWWRGGWMVEGRVEGTGTEPVPLTPVLGK
jgi:hypothetical protein